MVNSLKKFNESALSLQNISKISEAVMVLLPEGGMNKAEDDGIGGI